MPGASGRPREVAETPSDGLGVPSGVPRSPRGPGQKYKNIYLLWSPCKRPSLGAGFVFGALFWMKTYHCPALQGGRPLSAELVDLATIASLQGHAGKKVYEVAYLFCRREFGLWRRNNICFYIFELASLRGGGRARGFKLAVIRCRPFVGKEAWAHAFSCFH